MSDTSREIMKSAGRTVRLLSCERVNVELQAIGGGEFRCRMSLNSSSGATKMAEVEAKNYSAEGAVSDAEMEMRKAISEINRSISTLESFNFNRLKSEIKVE